MLQAVPQRYRSIIRIFSACLLTWLLIMIPLVPFAPASRGESRAADRESAKPQSPESSTAAATTNTFVNAPVPQPAPAPMYAPTITATKDDGIVAATPVAPGGTITYTVNVNNTGTTSPTDDALNVVFSDTIDTHTTLVPGSPIAAATDKYTTIGNVQITIPDGATDLLGNDFDPDTGNNTGMTATAETKSSTACTGGCTNNVTINANGSFTYDPPVGFTGTDTFTYTSNSGTSSISTTVTITVANKLWFINNNAGACTLNCDGRLSHPFTSLANFNTANAGGPGQPGDNDWIFIYESGATYTGPANLRLGQKFIGQDATTALIALTGFAQPSGTDPIPAVNSANGTIVQITSAAAGIALNSGNTLRGFTVGNTTGAKISGNNFGTLLVGNSTSPDVTLNGAGQALSLTTGILNVSGGFVSVTTTSSTAQGINLTGVSDSGVGAFSFGTTSVSGATTQGILIGTSTADLAFGATTVTGGTDAISLQNNSAGTKTFASITTSGNSGVGFLHGAGGGPVTVSGATSITNPGGNGIDIDSSNANLSFAGTTVSKNAAGTAVDLTNNAGRTISFTSLAITNSVGIGLNANNSGTVTAGAGSIATTGAGAAATLTGTALGLAFTSVSSNNGVNGITFSGGSGTFASGTTNLQNSGGIGLSMASSAVVANFGNTTVNSSAGAAVNLSSNSGNITFADLDLTPDSTFRGLDAQNNTGTITSTSGDIAATGAAAVFIDGPGGRTPLAMVLNNVDSTNSSGDGVTLTEISGSFTVNDATLATNISGSATSGISVNTSTATCSFGNTTVVNTTGAGILLNASTGTSVTFGTTTVTNTTGTGISITGSGATTFGTTSVTNTGNANADDTGTGIILTNNTGAMTFGALTLTPDSGERGLLATDNDGASAAGLITIPSGTITTINDTAVEIRGATTTARTPLNIQLTSLNTTGGAVAGNGIFLQNTSSSGSPGGFRVLGNAGTCTAATPTCTGGRITNTTGADGATGGTAVRLDTVDDVVLTRMRLDINTNFAVRGFSVTGFVMDTCVVGGTNGNNAAFSEGSVIFDNLFGTAAGSNSNLITASDIRGGWGDNIRVTNNTSTAGELTIQNSTIRDTNTGTNGNDNIQIVTHNSGNLKAVVTGSTFAATNGDHLQTAADGQSQLTIIFTGNTLSGGGGINALGQGITISGGDIVGGVTDSTEVMRFDISNNTMSGTIQGGAININEGSGAGNWQGRVSGNTIGVAATPGSGASQSSGIRVENHSKGTLTASVLNNQVHQWSNQGINLQAGDSTASGLGNGPLNVTVTGNTVDTPNHNPPTSVPDHGIQLNIATTTGNTNQACADFLNNNSSGNLAGGGVDYRLRERFLATVRLPGYTGANNDNAAVRTYILARPNTAAHGNPNDVAVANNVSAGGGGYINTNPAGSQCAQPTVPTAPAVVTQMFQAPRDAKTDVLAANPSQTGSEVAKTSATQSASANGPSFWQRTVTAFASFAGAFSSMIMPTAHAAETSAPAETAKPASEDVQRTKVMSNHAAPARRAVKTENMNHSAAPAMAAPMAGETVTANIGTLPAGGSVTIKFQVTVNNPPNLTLLGPPRVENQGTVSGSNFANVLTDDPEVVGLTQKTTTLIDLFNTTTNLVSNLNPSNFGDQVTFTATITESPAQGGADPTGTVDFIDTNNGNAVICDDVAVVAGQAQCQTSTLSAVTHDVQASYSGDGNFDPSLSNVVNQVVIPCTANPVVTTTADSGAGSLRQALADVCAGTTITFSLGAGPHTITALTPLVVAKNVTIRNNTGDRLTVSGNNLVRVFNVNSGKTANMIGLTIANGKSTTAGGGILNDGTLTIANSTLTGNNTDIDGGAISNSGTGTLTLINTTISGNNAAGNGGGVANLGGTVTSINSTFTNNRADNDANSIGTGGGIHHGSGTTTLKNTIVAGNFNENDPSADTADDISGTVDAASSFNLIGTGGAGGLSDGVNDNQVGVADAGLGALADNGGITQTHALLPTSTAVERGGNANLPADTLDLDGDADVGETLPVDQRGTGFPRNADSFDPDTIQTVDIGAFELHPSIEDIGNQTTNEDTPKDVTFNLGDDTGALIASVTATSSNATLVPNAPANLSFAGSGGSRTLTITPAANESGTTTITVTVTATNGRTATDTFDLTVDAVNDAPVANDDMYSTNEDTPLTVIAPGVLGNDTDTDTPPASLTAVLVVGPSNAASFALNPDGSFNYTPNSNFFGGDSFTYKANDGTSDSNIATVTITVNPINDPPSFTIAADPPASAQDAGPQTVNNFATNISPGPGESGQILTFNVSPTGSTGTLTFSTAPAINSTTGALTYTATNGTFGTASFSVTLSDNGSNTPPNSNTSGAQSFTITVFPPNASPVVTTTAGNLAYTENAGAVVIDPGLTVTDSDNSDLVGATVSITAGFVSAQDTLGFTNQNGITGVYNSGTGVLTLSGTASVGNYQTALRSVTYTNSSDDPTASRTITFTASDGISPAGSATRGIAITAVNDAPVNTVPVVAQSTNEDTPKVFSGANSNQISVGDVDLGANPIKITLTATNGTITLGTTAGLTFTPPADGVDDATMMFTGTLAAVNTALNGLTFTPTADFTGAASLQIISDDQGNTGTGGAKTDNDTVAITVNAVNDAPVVTATAGNLLYTENDPATAIDSNLTVTDVDNANLTGATVAITAGHVSAQDTLGFTNQNGITGIYDSGTGVLTLSGSSSVTNYQTALRSVTYQNSSDDPTASRTITFTANDGTTTGSATRGITITAVNDAPVNNVPGPQGTNENTPLTFSSGNGNQISVSDVDAGTSVIQVALTATDGTLTLSGTSGLNFACGGCNGDGTADATMTFQGTIANINTALNGMTFTPTLGFNGAATLTIVTNDLGNTGSGGPQQDTDVVDIQVATNLSIQDAQVAEPASGSVNMIFTVTLSAPAPAGGASVSFTTQDEPPAISHAVAGQDYTAQSGTLIFAAGEQFKTIAVPVLSDNKKNETNETFLVVLSNPVNATIADGTATGTILIQNQAGGILITEIRTSGPNGAGDDFVEIYNNSDSAHTVNGTGGGYGLFKMGATCGDSPVLVGVIPNGTTIPGRGHFLFTGPTYSLANYGGTGNALGDVSFSQEIESDRNVAIFSTTSVASISSANRLDAVGFGPNVGGICDLFREGNTLTPTAGSTLEYSYFRDECGKKGNPSLFGPCPTGGFTKDSNINSDDFIFADTNATSTIAGQRLGAPGPQNLGSPRLNLLIPVLLLDSTKGAAASPNRVRDTSAIGPNASQGTLSIRRRFVNNTGAPVTKLRFRVVDISTTFVPGGVADLRLLTSGNLTVSVSDPATCTASTLSSPCTVTVLGTILEEPPTQPLGGGYNSSTVTLATPLAPGASLNLQFLLGVQSSGSFKFFFNVEALP